MSRGGVTKLLECLIVNIEQFAPKMPDRQPKPAALTGEKYQSLTSIKRSAATASNIRKQMSPMAKINGDVARVMDEDLLTSSPIQRQMSWTPIMQTISGMSSDVPQRSLSEDILSTTSTASAQAVRAAQAAQAAQSAQSQAQSQSQAQAQSSQSQAQASAPLQPPVETTSRVTNGGIPSPPPSPTKEAGSPSASTTASTPTRPIKSPQKSRNASVPTESPSRLSSSPSSTSKLSTSPSSTSKLSTSPSSNLTPHFRGLMRASSSPVLPRASLAAGNNSNLNSKPSFPTLRKAPSDAALNWQKAGVRVKVAGSMVNELKALYEERAKGAEILVKTGSRRGRNSIAAPGATVN
ncbi:hypothetical protein ABW20_dc0105910 [Dactylellina cionopaga]|nr:hypothetical protein ABW20_dc0105910 [Dactylellina cionopaga]